MAVEGLWDSGTEQQGGSGPTSTNPHQAQSQEPATETSHTHINLQQHTHTRTRRNVRVHLHRLVSARYLPAGLLDTDTLSHCWLGIYFLKLNQCSALSLKPCRGVLSARINARQFCWTVHNGFITSVKCCSSGSKSITNRCWLYPADRRMCSQLLHGISSISVQSLHLSELIYILIWMSNFCEGNVPEKKLYDPFGQAFNSPQISFLTPYPLKLYFLYSPRVQRKTRKWMKGHVSQLQSWTLVNVLSTSVKCFLLCLIVVV